MSTRNLDLEVIEKALTSCPFGHPIFFRETLSSTQELAKELALSGAPEGALVLAECQSNGRGRLGRRWFSPERGGIYMSTILRPTIPLSDAQLLSLAAAVAVSEAMGKVYGLAVQVKWPNDILYDQKKTVRHFGRDDRRRRTRHLLHNRRRSQRQYPTEPSPR